MAELLWLRLWNGVSTGVSSPHTVIWFHHCIISLFLELWWQAEEEFGEDEVFGKMKDMQKAVTAAEDALIASRKASTGWMLASGKGILSYTTCCLQPCRL